MTLPAYAQVKAWIAHEIAAGSLRPGARVPSEHELVRRFGLSRMTINRALRELTQEGVIVRRMGLGTFVAAPRIQGSMLEVKDIAAEVRGRGHAYEARLLTSERTSADTAVAAALEIAPGTPVFHTVIVHREDGLPLQVEDRYVNPAFAPAYLDVDLEAVTPNAYLTSLGAIDDVEQIVEAVAPDKATAAALGITARDPCLRLSRRTWSRGMVATWARITAPGTRLRLAARFKPEEANRQ